MGTSLLKISRGFSHASINLYQNNITSSKHTSPPKQTWKVYVKAFFTQTNPAKWLSVGFPPSQVAAPSIRLCTSTTALSVIHPHCFALTTLPQWQVGTGLPMIMSTWVYEVRKLMDFMLISMFIMFSSTYKINLWFYNHWDQTYQQLD